MDASSLESQVRAMVKMSNAKAAAVTGSDFEPFVHETITHLGKDLSRDVWASGSAQAYAAIPGMQAKVSELVVDEKQQKVSTKVSFLANGEHEVYSDGFSYIFENGKIKVTASDRSPEEVEAQFKKLVGRDA